MPTLETREARRGAFNNPKRWRNAEQARSRKAAKRRVAQRRHLEFKIWKITHLTKDELDGLPLEVLEQLSRDAQRRAGLI